MSEITQTRAEDAIASTTAFLESARGTGIDGGLAGQQVAEHVKSVGDVAREILTTQAIPGMDGYYLAVGRLSVREKTYFGSDYDLAVSALPGHLVLVPGGRGSGSSFYPAVVSEDGMANGVLRLHVLGQPYRRQLSYSAAMVLSAAGQSETTGVGEDKGEANDSVEAEHFATLLAAGTDTEVQRAWRSGEHVNHAWRQQPKNSVTAQVSARLFEGEIPQATITITRQQVLAGKAMLLWHAGMRDASGQPETATKDKALVVMQGLGYEALLTKNPRGIDTIKSLIA